MKKTLVDYIKEVVHRNEKTTEKNFSLQARWRPVTSIAKKLGISHQEALIFSLAYYYTLTKKTFFPHEMREQISDDPFDTAEVLVLLEQLKNYRLLESCSINSNEFNVKTDTIIKISKNEIPVFEKNSTKGTDLFSLSDELTSIFYMRQCDMHEYHEFIDEFNRFYNANMQYPPFKYLIKHKIPQDEWFVFLYVFLAHLNGKMKVNINEGVKEFYLGVHYQFKMRKKFTTHESVLIQKKIISFIGDNFQSAEWIKITNIALKAILKDDFSLVQAALNEDNMQDVLTSPTSIVERNLYFNKNEQDQLKTVTDILQPNRLKEIQKKLLEAGHREGVCVLLHGLPGTGKTESILQIAKKTGRSIMKVDISSIRDKYIGETEKNIKAIFVRYEQIREKSSVTPILLFNEADALFNKRVKVEQNADQMNNTLQNILLEELENFKGVLFATTNLAPNMDKAFERRFLYKIEFMQPQEMIRRDIWAEHLPAVQLEDIHRIAETCDLSGGQIENVVKKIKLEHILYDNELNIDAIIQLCKEEFINSSSANGTKIGFKK